MSLFARKVRILNLKEKYFIPPDTYTCSDIAYDKPLLWNTIKFKVCFGGSGSGVLLSTYQFSATCPLGYRKNPCQEKYFEKILVHNHVNWPGFNCVLVLGWLCWPWGVGYQKYQTKSLSKNGDFHFIFPPNQVRCALLLISIIILLDVFAAFSALLGLLGGKTLSNIVLLSKHDEEVNPDHTGLSQPMENSTAHNGTSELLLKSKVNNVDAELSEAKPDSREIDGEVVDNDRSDLIYVLNTTDGEVLDPSAEVLLAKLYQRQTFSWLSVLFVQWAGSYTISGDIVK